jgi:transcription antitermination protein NusB
VTAVAPHSDKTPPPGAKKPAFNAASKSGRRRAREVALQGLYEWLVSRAEPALVEANLREHEGFEQCDVAHFTALLYGAIAQATEIDAVLSKHVDRLIKNLSPVEHGVLMIGVYELQHCIDIPYKVVINEAVELAKNFGGTDGHKYVNGVLDKVSLELRRVEVEAYRAARAAPSKPTPAAGSELT